MAFTRGLLICAALTMSLATAACGENSASDPNRTVRKGGGLFTKEVVEKPAGYYYRITAGYTVRETGEYLPFDFVVACGATVTHWRYTGPSTRVRVDPKVMIMPTSTGAAVMMRSFPTLCENGVRSGQNGEYGALLDVLPFVVWFDDANDLSFGWGYATEDAYHNANSRLKFEGAAVNVASFDEWKKWREKAAADYVQVGAIPGPWGFSYGDTPKPLLAEIIKRNGGNLITNACIGYVRIPAPKDVIDKIWASAPEHNPAPVSERYFVINADNKWLLEILTKAGPVFNERDFHDYRGEIEGASVGAINRNNGGFIRHNWNRNQVIGDHFPLLPRSRSTPPPITAPRDEYPRRILIGEEWKGMTACGGDSGIPGPDRLFVMRPNGPGSSVQEVDPENSFDPNFASKKFPLILNDEVIVENLYDDPKGRYLRRHFIIDREGYIYSGSVWGFGGI